MPLGRAERGSQNLEDPVAVLGVSVESAIELDVSGSELAVSVSVSELDVSVSVLVVSVSGSELAVSVSVLAVSGSELAVSVSVLAVSGSVLAVSGSGALLCALCLAEATLASSLSSPTTISPHLWLRS